MLVSPEWLHARLDDPSLRIIDCSAQLIPAGRPSGSKADLRITSRRTCPARVT
jgi:hypothetical protein